MKRTSVSYTHLDVYKRQIMDSVLTCTVDPNFRNEEAVRKANVLSPEQLVNKLLLPGEVMELYRAISELSGFDKEPEELKDEVKN